MRRFDFSWTTLLILFHTVTVSAFSLRNILSELNLSSDARVHLRDKPGYAAAVKRWQYWKAPDYAVVIEVGTENDVAEAIRFANLHHIPFLAQSGAHGGTSALGDLKDGMQIHLRHLNSVLISADGTYVTIGGGIKGVELRDELWKFDKWTVTGMCECPGHVAATLGGGIGILQGKYGLPSDQIIALNVVLANGTAIKVSRNSHPDLFWAMRGAGHNFGIVTSMDYRIYDTPEDGRTWSHETLTYDATPENIRKVYSIGQAMLDSDSQPGGMMLMGVITSSPDFDGKVVIEQHIVHNSPLPTLTHLTHPYHALSPLTTSSHHGTYLDIPRWFGVHDTSIACDPEQVMSNPAYLRFPVNLRSYDLDALVATVHEFTQFMKLNPEFGGSTIMIEQWPTQGVRERGREEGAVSWRENMVLIAPALLYSRDPTSSKLDDVAWAAGEKMRKMLVDGAGRSGGGHYAYVNYASGGEGVEEIYGEENVERLRGLKRVYDPDNRFRFYAPLEIVDRRHRERDEL